MARLIVGLGNPGKQYEWTRHNLGYLVVNKLAEKMGVHFQKKTLGKVGSAMLDDEKVYLLLPTTYMNLSGEAVGHFVNFYKLQSTKVLVVLDDVDIPFGTMRLRRSGGSGGHNGLKNITQHLGTQEYPRLRIGIYKKEARDNNLADFVLQAFSQTEREKLPGLLDQVCTIIQKFIAESEEQAIEMASHIDLSN